SYSVWIRLANEGCGSEHDNSRDKCCHARVRQDFVENSGHCIPRAASPVCVARPLQDHGEKVKFFELVPLNARKKQQFTRQARPRCPHLNLGGSDDLSPSCPPAVIGRLRLNQSAVPSNALIRFVCSFDAVLELEPIVWEVFGHFIDPTRYIATDCRPEHYALADMELM